MNINAKHEQSQNGNLNYVEFCQSIYFDSFNSPPQNIPSFSLGILKYLLVKERTAVSATETSGKKKIEGKPAYLIY